MLPLIVYRRPIRRRIRLAREQDKATVIEIANVAFAPKDRTLWIQGAFGRSDRTIHVLETFGEIRGFVITRVDGEDLRIDLIGCHPFGFGYGTDLMRAVEFLAPPMLKNIVAGTHSDNEDARAFYDAIGFEIC